MFALFFLVFLAAFIASVVFFVQSLRLKRWGGNHILAKKKALISIAVTLIAFVGLAMTAPPAKSMQNASDSAKTESSENSSSKKTNADAPEARKEEEKKEESDKKQSEYKKILIHAGEAGEYGRELVLNEKTDMPYKLIGYFVPAGKYNVQNIGKYPTQVTVYKNEKHMTEEGFEEWADGLPVLIQKNAFAEITVKDGYFVKVDAPSVIELSPVN